MNTVTTNLEVLPQVPPAGDLGFAQLGLVDPLLRALADAKHTIPTPIQAEAIPAALSGRDVLGAAQTGTGKTAAFALPILQRLMQMQAAPTTPTTPPSRRNTNKPIRALVLSPTRELASQISQSFATYGRFANLRHTVVYGGVSQSGQVQALRRGVDILIATPGRLGDLMRQGFIRLNDVQFLVLDEADRMLDQGFLPEVRQIAALLPSTRQTLFFSATMPHEIRALANQLLKTPVEVSVSKSSSTPEKVSHAVYHVDQKKKRALLDHILADEAVTRAIIFTRTKHTANRLAEQLIDSSVRAEAIHGNKSQNAREKALAMFSQGRIRVLVATDVASRGIDVNGISHVVNFDIPTDPEAYVHRIGRTGRAGASGNAVSFCSSEERAHLAAIERLLKSRIAIIKDHPHALAVTEVSHRPSGPGASRPPRRYDRPANYDRQPRSDRPGNYDRSARADRSAGYDRAPRADRPAGYDRPVSYDRPQRSDRRPPSDDAYAPRNGGGFGGGFAERKPRSSASADKPGAGAPPARRRKPWEKHKPRTTA